MTMGSLMVFAPTPLLTVTLERSADDGAELHVHAGGQGVWQARMARSLGVEVTLCACVGGEIGRVLEPLIAHEGVDLKLVHRQGTNGWYLDDRRTGSRERLATAFGDPLGRHEVDELYGLALTVGLQAKVSVLSGPADPSLLSATVYRRLAADLNRLGGLVIADLSGDYTDASLAGRVHLLKVSDVDLMQHGRLASTDEDTLMATLADFCERGADAALISRAHEPAIALLEGRFYSIKLPRLEEADHRGAGDSMTAGVAATLAQGGDLKQAVRAGAAAGALNVTRHGLGTGNAEAVRTLAEHVQLQALS